MGIHVHESEVPAINREGGAKLIGEKQGCRNGFCLGISFYRNEEYRAPGVHQDQEGFYVLAGEGFAKVGEEEFAVRPGSLFVALPGVAHQVKAAPGKGPVKVLWTHGSV